MPGYAAIFRHPNDELNFCTYIIPGGKAVPSDLKALHHGLLDQNSIVRRHLGSGYKIEPMKGAWLRLGGIPKSYADNLLIIGDAAGHIDPLTGEGIQFAMEGAEKAAETLIEALRVGRFDEQFLSDLPRQMAQGVRQQVRACRESVSTDGALPGAGRFDGEGRKRARRRVLLRLGRHHDGRGSMERLSEAEASDSHGRRRGSRAVDAALFALSKAGRGDRRVG